MLDFNYRKRIFVYLQALYIHKAFCACTNYLMKDDIPFLYNSTFLPPLLWMQDISIIYVTICTFLYFLHFLHDGISRIQYRNTSNSDLIAVY